MRIHHIAVYVRDMAVVSEFIEKYFEANQSWQLCLDVQEGRHWGMGR